MKHRSVKQAKELLGIWSLIVRAGSFNIALCRAMRMMRHQVILFFMHVFFIFSFKKIIGIWLTYNIVLVSCVQQSESVIYKNVSLLFFPYRLLKTIK